MVLLFLIPATLSYERTGAGDTGAGIGLRLPVRLVGLGGAQRAGYVAGFLEATLLVRDGNDVGRISAGSRATYAVYRGFGPHVEVGAMADARANVGLGGFVGAGISLGERAGSVGLDYRYLAGHDGHGHQLALSYLLLLPFE
jgi:hypothetical protein